MSGPQPRRGGTCLLCLTRDADLLHVRRQIGGNRQMQGERGSGPWLARHRESSPHALGEPLGNGETQTRTVVLAGRAAVDLAELVEDVREDVRGDANTGIADGDCNLALQSLGTNPDLALIGVLDRITSQIEQDL